MKTGLIFGLFQLGMGYFAYAMIRDGLAGSTSGFLLSATWFFLITLVAFILSLVPITQRNMIQGETSNWWLTTYETGSTHWHSRGITALMLFTGYLAAAAGIVFSHNPDIHNFGYFMIIFCLLSGAATLKVRRISKMGYVSN